VPVPADNESLAFEACRSTFIDCRVTKAPAGKLGVGTARSLGKQLQAGVVGDRHANGLSTLQAVQALAAASACTPATCPARFGSLTHVSSLTYMGCSDTDIHEEAGIMAVTGPDFISLQVRDLERSALLRAAPGLKRSDAGPPHAVVFDTKRSRSPSRRRRGRHWTNRAAGQGMALCCTPRRAGHPRRPRSPARRSSQRQSTGRSAALSRSRTPTLPGDPPRPRLSGRLVFGQKRPERASHSGRPAAGAPGASKQPHSCVFSSDA